MNASTRNYVIRQLTPERGFDLIRMYLGIGLLVRGMLLFNDPTFVGALIGAEGATPLGPRLVAFGHVMGGALLALGLYTRLAATMQAVPVLGALLLIHASGDLASSDQSLEFSALVLVLLAFFAYCGPGAWSLDERRRSASGRSTRARQRKMALKQRQVQVRVDRKLL